MRKIRQIQFLTFLTSIFFSFSKKERIQKFYFWNSFLSNASETRNFYPIITYKCGLIKEG